MDELREIIGLLKELPTLAVWVLVGFWCYKVIIIGSIYGLIKFIVQRVYEAYAKETVIRKELKLGSLIIGGDDGAIAQGLVAQLTRLASKGGYIHGDAIVKLRTVIDELEAKNTL